LEKLAVTPKIVKNAVLQVFIRLDDYFIAISVKYFAFGKAYFLFPISGRFSKSLLKSQQGGSSKRCPGTAMSRTTDGECSFSFEVVVD
jgi:hypothetical protein